MNEEKLKEILKRLNDEKNMIISNYNSPSGKLNTFIDILEAILEDKEIKVAQKLKKKII